MSAPNLSDRDHIQGEPTASVTLLEYGDFESTSCGALTPIVKRLQRTLGQRLRFVFRHFPMSDQHPNAMLGAQAAEAAALQDRFWEMFDLIYEDQSALSLDAVQRWAKQLGLDMKRFMSDLESPAVAKRIRLDFLSGTRIGVENTPCFFIDGEPYKGLSDYDKMMAALEKTLAANRRN